MDGVQKRFESYLLVSIMVVLSSFSSSLWALEIEATTQWYQRVEITPLRSGVVEKIPVTVGDRVKQGDLLLQLESQLEESQQLLASKRLEHQKLLHTEAQREYERIEDLYDRTLISEHDRALGEAAWVGAAAELQTAKRAQAQAERDMRYSQIRAPFDAVVVARTADLGTTVNHLYPQPPLLTIASTAFIAVDGYLSQRQLAKITKGESMQIKLAGRRFKGTVASVALEPEAGKKGKYRLRLLIPYTKHSRAGMSAVILTN